MGKEKKNRILVIIVIILVVIGAVFAMYKGAEKKISQDQVSLQERMKALRTHK